MNNKHFHRPKNMGLELAAVGGALILGHVLGSFGDWYDKFPWFDIAVHFVGGVWVTFAIFALVPLFEKISDPKKLILSLVFAALGAGVAWEILEFTIENYYLVDFQGPPLDTLSDLIVDVLGGTLAAFYIRNLKSQIGRAHV